MLSSIAGTSPLGNAVAGGPLGKDDGKKRRNPAAKPTLDYAQRRILDKPLSQQTGSDWHYVH